jgi:pyruvate dehydrogenase E1 component
MHHGLKEMYEQQKRVFYYITLMNENYEHPEMPKGVEDNIIKGMYLFKAVQPKAKLKVQLLGSGTIFNEVLAAAEILEKEYKVSANIWSVTSFNELRRNALAVSRENLLRPENKVQQTYVEQCLSETDAPVIAATDYIRAFADQIREFVPYRYTVLGTDGYGRSDTRKALRHFFEVDAKHIVYAALKTLFDEGKFKKDELLKARDSLGINPDKINPVTI